IGVFLGNIAKTSGSTLAGVSALGIFPHGLFELLAYSTGALAGGILSHAMVTRKINNLDFFHVVYDAAKLTAWAILFLAVAAFIESTGAAA
ncbi:stage II sporulation protein M, partial [Candidatus Micrarchaeota archaeon]|nr:stage II sporulation protein M [Candidatus Micrarchaeota archaeon]